MPVWLGPIVAAVVGACIVACSWIWRKKGSASSLAVQASIRAAAWGVGIYIALFPALSVSNTGLGSLADMAAAAHRAGHYRDFYFIAVVAAVLGLTTTLVHIFKYHDGLALWARFVFALLSFFFIAAAVEGVSRFVDLARNSAANADVLATDLTVIFWTLVAGLVAELAVVLREHAP